MMPAFNVQNAPVNTSVMRSKWINQFDASQTTAPIPDPVAFKQPPPAAAAPEFPPPTSEIPATFSIGTKPDGPARSKPRRSQRIRGRQKTSNGDNNNVEFTFIPKTTPKPSDEPKAVQPDVPTPPPTTRSRFVFSFTASTLASATLSPSTKRRSGGTSTRKRGGASSTRSRNACHPSMPTPPVNSFSTDDPAPPPTDSPFATDDDPSLRFHIGIQPKPTKHQKKSRRRCDDVRRRMCKGRSMSGDRQSFGSNNEPKSPDGAAVPLPFEIPLPPSPRGSDVDESRLDEEFDGLGIHDVPEAPPPHAPSVAPPPQSSNGVQADDTKQRFCIDHTKQKTVLSTPQCVRCWGCSHSSITSVASLAYCHVCAAASDTCPIRGCRRPLAEVRRVARAKPLPKPPQEAVPEWIHLKKAGGKAYSDGDFIRAAELYSKALEILDVALGQDLAPQLQVEKAKLLSNRAAALMTLHKIKEALEDGKEAVRNDATYLRAYLRVAKCHLLLGQWEDARNVYREVERQLSLNSAHPQYKSYKAQLKEGFDDVNNLQAYLHRAKSYSDTKDLFSALEMTERAMDIAYASRELRVQTMTLLFALRYLFIDSTHNLTSGSNYDKARKYCETLVQKEGHSSGVLGLGIDMALLYARSLRYLEQLDDADRMLKQLERAAPTSTAILKVKHLWESMTEVRSVANNAFKAGNYEAAIKLYTKALQLDADDNVYNAMMHGNRAAAYMSTKQFRDALDDCDTSLKQNPKYFKALLRRARCYHALKQYKESLRDFDAFAKDGGLSQDELQAIKNERAQVKKEWDQAKRPKQPAYDSNSYAWADFDYDPFHNFGSAYGQRANNPGSAPRNKNRSKTSGKSQQKPSSGSQSRNNSSSRPQYTPPPPPPKPEKSHYEILQVSMTATAAEIKKSYRKLALIYHPDKAKTAEDGELFKLMTVAYTVLSDVHTKAKYDKELRYGGYGMYYEY
ncbi:Aste57867_17071 [Aphanomyces stellatus]|uniref:Aste57867_17071 protein n=1 Tax=Aphanomyces stellatus TaxID=120398 RepID=A0A485L7P9_9STRA|nr:hypothetical protein As57867_017013 [Aphanomyces stellatus]VFT93832.1 Aste57867_17071 [Aphanomyces stellatus]